MSAIIPYVFVLQLFLNSFPLENVNKTYVVKKINEPINITGNGDDKRWQQAMKLSDFIYPWETDTPPHTSLKSLHDETWIYFLFEAEDHNINIFVKSNNKREAVRSDRVEIFFKVDDAMKVYYCLEIDPLARVFDCKGEYYRKLDTEWSWPQGQLQVKSYQHDTGYSVELRISKNSLEHLGLLKDHTIHAGLFRADCYQLIDDDAKFRWISWINPGSSNPDFHIPEAFGELKLEN
jgi:Carbohydrate family 9 binding domain-like